VHVPVPWFLIRPARRAYGYFRTGVAVEGSAWLCDHSHVPFIFGGGSGRVEFDRVPQHVDVELRFWNRRGGRVTIMEVAAIDLPLRTLELAVSTFDPFESVTLEEGSAQETRNFVLVPKDAPEERVEAAVGDPLELQFRSSRGSERWARPRIRLQLGVRSP
jgi:hypothetical protein